MPIKISVRNNAVLLIGDSVSLRSTKLTVYVRYRVPVNARY